VRQRHQVSSSKINEGSRAATRALLGQESDGNKNAKLRGADAFAGVRNSSESVEWIGSAESSKFESRVNLAL